MCWAGWRKSILFLHKTAVNTCNFIEKCKSTKAWQSIMLEILTLLLLVWYRALPSTFYFIDTYDNACYKWTLGWGIKYSHPFPKCNKDALFWLATHILFKQWGEKIFNQTPGQQVIKVYMQNARKGIAHFLVIPYTQLCLWLRCRGVGRDKGHTHSLVSNLRETLLLTRYKSCVPALMKSALIVEVLGNMTISY